MGLQEIYPKRNRAANVKDKNLVLDYLSNKQFERYLDTGCAEGDFTLRVAQKVGATDIQGIEIVDEQAKKAEKQGIKITRKDLNKPLPYKNNYFDLITSIQNIEHLYFTDTYLAEMKRILKKKGTFILTTTNLAAIHYRLMLLLGIQPMCLHPSIHQTWPLHGKNPLWGHKSIFTFPALREVLEIHDFKIIKAYTHTLYFVPDFLEKIILKVFPNFGTFSCFVVEKK